MVLGERFETESLTATHWLAVVLAVATGVIHVYAGLVEGRVPVTLAGLGFFGAVVLLLADVRRSLLYPIGIVYTGVQFPLWYVTNAGEYTTLGYADKVLQAGLAVLLVSLLYRSRRRATTRGGESTLA